MKNINNFVQTISKLFNSDAIDPAGEKLNNLRELRSVKHANGVRVYGDLVADVLSVKAEILNSVAGVDGNIRRPRVLSISRTVYP